MNRKSKSPAVPPSNDVTPYYSVESVGSPLRTDRPDPTVYLSALSATPQPSPVHPQTKRSLASASTSTERPIKSITLESGAQTTSSINVLTQPGADFAMQTSDSLEDRDKSPTTPAKIAKDSKGNDVESGITEPSVDRAETNSSASQVHVYDNSEPDVAKVARVKKMRKPRYKSSSPPSVESSFIAPKRYISIAKEDRSSTEEASLESQAYREQKLPTTGPYIYRADSPYSNRYDEKMTDPVPTRNYQDDPNELGTHDSDNVNQEPQNQVTRTGSSTSTLSSEPYLQGGYSTNLLLGNAFLYMTIPPDGGYGWFVVVISFFCQLIVDGIIFAIGILLPYIAEDLNVSQSTITVVISVQVGPVASAVINKYGYRIVALVGATCSVIFILIATFSHNVGTLIFFYSLLAGPSLSLVWVASQLIIGYYFERHRPIANGISCSGAGAGIFVFSIVNAEICPKIGWRNTSRIHAALLLLVIFMAIAYIEVTPTRIAKVKKDDKSSSSSSDERMSLPLTQIRYSRYQRSPTIIPTNSDRGLEQMIEEYKGKRTRKIERLCPCCFPAQKVRTKSDETTRTSDDESDDETDSVQPKTFIVRIDPIEREDLFYTGPVNYDSDHQISSRRTTSHVIDIDHQQAKSVHYSLSVTRSQRRYQQTKRRTIAELRNRHKFPLLAYISPLNWMPEKLLNAFAKLFDTNLLKIMEFRILLLSAFFYPMGFNIPFLFTKMRAQVDPFYASLIPATIGLSNFVFRIASGVAANKLPAQTTYVCGGGIIFGGVATFVSAFYGADVVWFQFTFATCYGVAPAFYSTLRAIIYVRTLGLDKLTNAFGLTGMAMGFGVFLGTSTAAFLNSLTNSYSAAFAFSGMCLIIAGLLKIILPTVIRVRAKRLEQP